jgi:hypothetical protein
MEQPTLGYDDFCQILGRVTLESYLRFEQFNGRYQAQIDRLAAQLDDRDQQLATVLEQNRLLQANLDIAQRSLRGD